MTRDECDVLVVGLGPAGASAAAAAAGAGARVIAIEKRREIGVPVQCAEFVPLPMGGYVQTEGVLCQRVERMGTLLPGGTVEHSHFPGYMVNRAAFDQALVGRARGNGARILAGTRLTALDDGAQIAVVASGRAYREIGFSLVIGADGPHSAVAAMLGLPALEAVHTRQYSVPLLAKTSETSIWLSQRYAGGYAWLFPKGPAANLGLGAGRRWCANLKRPLEELHGRLVRQGMVGPQVLARTGGAIPVGGLTRRLAQGHALFAGDAGGLTHPITGAGIAAAVISGEGAGRAAAGRVLEGRPRALTDYEDEIRDRYQASLDRAVAARRQAAPFWGTPDGELDAVHRRAWIAFHEYYQ